MFTRDNNMVMMISMVIIYLLVIAIYHIVVYYKPKDRITRNDLILTTVYMESIGFIPFPLLSK